MTIIIKIVLIITAIILITVFFVNDQKMIFFVNDHVIIINVFCSLEVYWFNSLWFSVNMGQLINFPFENNWFFPLFLFVCLLVYSVINLIICGRRMRTYSCFIICLLSNTNFHLMKFVTWRYISYIFLVSYHIVKKKVSLINLKKKNG